MDYLAHHGIKGQRWYVRRFQNKDGSLTEAGRRRYLSNGNRTYKQLRKQVELKRADLSGAENSSRRYVAARELFAPIGDNSKNYLESINKKRDEYFSRKEFLDITDRYNKLEEASRSGAVSEDEYWRKTFELEQEMADYTSKRDFTDPYQVLYEPGKYGKKYLDSYLNRDGKDLSVAYLLDLGYNRKAAEELVDVMIKSGRTLGDI